MKSDISVEYLNIILKKFENIIIEYDFQIENGFCVFK